MTTQKATYADLIARRTSTQRRTVRKPLCLDMALWDAYLTAKEAHEDAERAAEAERAVAQEGRATRRRHADVPATEATAKALAAAADAMEAMSLWLHFRIPSAMEQDKLIAKLDDLKSDDGSDAVKGGTEWMIAYLAECFDHATTLDGDKLDDFTPAALSNELENLSGGRLLDMHQAVVKGIMATDFPTQPRP